MSFHTFLACELCWGVVGGRALGHDLCLLPFYDPTLGSDLGFLVVVA
jgi:hypothetical protein